MQEKNTKNKMCVRKAKFAGFSFLEKYKNSIYIKDSFI